jgi:hypothetical protein
MRPLRLVGSTGILRKFQQENNFEVRTYHNGKKVFFIFFGFFLVPVRKTKFAIFGSSIIKEMPV